MFGKSAEKKDVAVVKDTLPASADPFVNMVERLAANKDVDAEKLEKLVDVQLKVRRENAEQEFGAALARFQGECPPIARSRQADRYTYAPIEDIMATIQPALSANGLSVTFDTEQLDNGMVKATCTLTHAGGHKRTSYFTGEVDSESRASKSINPMQRRGVTNSYVKRYALSNALNLTFGGEDTDGRLSSEFVSDDQAEVIKALLEKVDAGTQARFFKWALQRQELTGEESPWDIPAKRFDEAVANLKKLA